MYIQFLLYLYLLTNTKIMQFKREKILLDKITTRLEELIKEIKDQKSEDKDHSLDLGKLTIITEIQELTINHRLEIMKRDKEEWIKI